MDFYAYVENYKPNHSDKFPYDLNRRKFRRPKVSFVEGSSLYQVFSEESGEFGSSGVITDRDAMGRTQGRLDQLIANEISKHGGRQKALEIGELAQLEAGRRVLLKALRTRNRVIFESR